MIYKVLIGVIFLSSPLYSMDQMGEVERSLFLQFHPTDPTLIYHHFISYGGHTTATLIFYYIKAFSLADGSLEELEKMLSQEEPKKSFESLSFVPAGFTYVQHQAFGGGSNKQVTCLYSQKIVTKLAPKSSSQAPDKHP